MTASPSGHGPVGRGDVPLFESEAHARRFRRSLAARRAVPLPLLVRARAAVSSRRPRTSELARLNMELVLGDRAPAEQVEEMARRSLAHAAWRLEAHRRPPVINRQAVVGAEHLRSALDEGRGVLISIFHHGDYMGSPPSLARLGLPVEFVAMKECFEAGADSNVKAATTTLLSVEGPALLDVRGGSRLIRERLSAGKAVVVALDIIGHTPARVFGRDLQLSSGGLRIAAELGAPVIALTSQRPSRRYRAGATVLSEALRPEDFDGPLELHAEVVRRLEEAALAWPEAMHKPHVLLTRGI